MAVTPAFSAARIIAVVSCSGSTLPFMTSRQILIARRNSPPSSDGNSLMRALAAPMAVLTEKILSGSLKRRITGSNSTEVSHSITPYSRWERVILTLQEAYQCTRWFMSRHGIGSRAQQGMSDDKRSEYKHRSWMCPFQVDCRAVLRFPSQDLCGEFCGRNRHPFNRRIMMSSSRISPSSRSALGIRPTASKL